MQKISPFLWFDDQAEEAVNFYTSVFRDAKVGGVQRYGDAGPGPKGSVMSVTFELFGQEFIALNGGPLYRFSPAISFLVHCETQDEVDHLWNRLSEGGRTQQCGWLTDRFGVTWQIVPTALGRLLRDKDAAGANRVMQAMLKMTKLDIGRLEQACRQG